MCSAVYSEIDPLPLNYWYVCHREENDRKLKEFIKMKNIRSIIEIGAFLGKSAIEMAKVLPAEGKIIAIDNFEWQSNVPSEISIYHQCLSNVIHENVQNEIDVIKADHKQIHKKLSCKADLIYIDGDHSTVGCYEDLVNYFPLLNADGILCGDDWAYQGREPWVFYVDADFVENERSPDITHEDQLYPVRVAVKSFAKERNLKIFSCANFWWYE